MTAPDAPPSIESMLAYRAWVRGLARELVRDESHVDDVEQATWLAALEAPPREAASLGGWLKRVVTSRAIDAGRAESRRAKREKALARPEAQPSDADLVERAEILRDVAAAVCALDEPYRGTILLRHFEDLPPREIAARQGVSVETVHTRLRRAHEQLRARLDGEYGDRRAWCALLVPLATRGNGVRTGGAAVGTGALVLGGLAMGKATVAAVGVLAALAGWWLLRPAAPAEDAGVKKDVASAPAKTDGERTAAAPRQPRKRDVAEADATPPAAAPAAAAQPTAARADGKLEAVGRVVWDDTGEPAKHFEFVAVDVVDDEPVFVKVTGDDGVFRAALPHAATWETARFVVEGEPIARFGPQVVVPSEKETVLRVPRGGAATIVVLAAETGAPIAGARAYAARQRDFFMSGEHILPGGATLAQAPRTGQGDGRIALGRPARESQWFVVAAGREWRTVEVASGATQEVRLRPAGSLRVSIPKWKELDAANVDVTEGESDRVDHMDLPPPNAAGVTVVEGVLPGKHEVAVRRGRAYEHGVVYGRADVEIVAGAETRVTIDVQATPPRKKVAVTGTIHVPESWGAWPRSIEFDGVEEENADFRNQYARLTPPAQGRDMKFTLKNVPEGKYHVCVDPFQWRKEVVVTAAASDLTLDVGEACEVVVKVLDDATNARASGAELMWHTLLPGQSGWSSEMPEPRAEDGAFALRAPPGTVHVDAKATGLVAVQTTVEAAVGAVTPLTIRLVRGATLVVKVEIDGKPFAVDRPFVSVERKMDDGTSTGVWRPAPEGVATFDGQGPGPCTVSLRLDGGWTCVPEEVVLKAGETTTVTLKLTKKP